MQDSFQVLVALTRWSESDLKGKMASRAQCWNDGNNKNKTNTERMEKFCNKLMAQAR